MQFKTISPIGKATFVIQISDVTYIFPFQANMHAAFSYDRRDPYARLPLESHISSANDPSNTSITSVNNVNDHVS